MGRRREITEILLIIALYYVTGGAFSYTNYSLQIIAFFLISMFLCIRYHEIYKFRLRSVFIPWLLMTFFIMLVPLLFNDSIPTYIAIVFQLCIGLFCAAIIPPDHFVEKYVKVIVVFAAISLVGFAIGMIMPSLATRLPVVIGSASVDYYNAGIYVFMRAKGYSSLVLMTRNPGICWEPGCYQSFLNIGLLFLLDMEGKEHQRHFWLKFIILVVTILTTMSLTGIFVMLMILLFYNKEWIKINLNIFILVPIGVIILCFVLKQFSIVPFLSNKIAYSVNESNALTDRLSIDRIQYIFSDNGFPYLFGMSFAKWVDKDITLWNSVIHSFLCLGIPFTVVQLVGYRKGSKVLVRKSLLLFVIMIISASTETLFWRVFFNTIAFYGWIYLPLNWSTAEQKQSI